MVANALHTGGNDGTADVVFDQALIERYGGRGPRYTSYPTALQFSGAVNAAAYEQHARLSNHRPQPLSLYVHIPFCQSLCYYCGCNKIVTRNQARVDRYLELLHREIELQSGLFDRSRKTRQLHFGGGTPTYLGIGQLALLMEALDDAFRFEPVGQREFSIEVDPRSIEHGSMRHLAELGFNRISLGIQDFDPDVQRAVNREQTRDDIHALVNDARSHGIESISFDLIYGLPLQSVARFDATLDTVIGMRPDRLAVYNYAHLPERFKGQRMIRDTDIPSPQTRLEILHHTIDRLMDAGYQYVGMDHFALPDDELVMARYDGSLQRNFQGYSTHGNCDLIGLGASAISSIGELYAQNEVTTAGYEASLESGRLPVVRGIVVDADDRRRADVIQTLMCFDRLSFDDFERRHAVDFGRYFETELECLAPLARDGLVEIDDAGISITPSGRLLLRSIAMVFDRHLVRQSDERRFSKAI